MVAEMIPNMPKKIGKIINDSNPAVTPVTSDCPKYNLKFHPEKLRPNKSSANSSPNAAFTIAFTQMNEPNFIFRMMMVFIDAPFFAIP